jgi:hypothetical protein
MALWTAVRMLRDRSALLQRMAEQSEERDQPRSAEQFRREAEDATRQAELVRETLARAAAGALRRIAGGESEDAVGAKGSS